MPLFRQPHGQLKWDDIKDLVGREVPENELLDYKGDSSHRIERVIAAMANTYGGDIIVGVNERANDDGKPEELSQVRGRPNALAIKQSIEEMNFNIHPPVLGMDVQVVGVPLAEHPDRRGDCAVVVVRIHQSDLVPHFVANQGHFRRAGSHGRPYRSEHMTTEMIQWLEDRRRRHVEFRDDLLTWLDEIHWSVAWHKVWCVPQFPSPGARLWEGRRNNLWDAIPRVPVKDGTRPFFWSHLLLEPTHRYLQNGVVWRIGSTERGMPVEWADRPGSAWLSPAHTLLVDDRGLVAVKGIAEPEVMARAHEVVGTRVESDGTVIDWTIIATHLVGVSRFASSLYAGCGYSGPVQFGIEIGLTAGVKRHNLFLGMSDPPTLIGRAIRDVPVTCWEAPARQLSNNPLVARNRHLTEVHECLAGGLVGEVRRALSISAWTRAFDYEMQTASAEECVAGIEAAFDAAQ